MQPSLKTGFLILIGLAFVIGALAPTAQGAPTLVAKNTSGDPPAIKPEIGSGKIHVKFTYSLENVYQPAFGETSKTEAVTVSWDRPGQTTNVHLAGPTL